MDNPFLQFNAVDYFEAFANGDGTYTLVATIPCQETVGSDVVFRKGMINIPRAKVSISLAPRDEYDNLFTLELLESKE